VAATPAVAAAQCCRAAATWASLVADVTLLKPSAGVMGPAHGSSVTRQSVHG
jgi:hypothetical protein